MAGGHSDQVVDRQTSARSGHWGKLFARHEGVRYEQI